MFRLPTAGPAQPMRAAEPRGPGDVAGTFNVSVGPLGPLTLGVLRRIKKQGG